MLEHHNNSKYDFVDLFRLLESTTIKPRFESGGRFQHKLFLHSTSSFSSLMLYLQSVSLTLPCHILRSIYSYRIGF